MSDPGPYEAIAGFYDRWCDEVVEGRAASTARPASKLPRARDRSLGAGTGRISVPVAQDGAPVWALDLSPAMLARLRERAAAAGVADRIETAVGDLEALLGALRPTA